MTGGGTALQLERLRAALATAAEGNGPWRPALESMLLLARASRPGDEALVAAALRLTSRALAVSAARGSVRGGIEREAAVR